MNEGDAILFFSLFLARWDLTNGAVLSFSSSSPLVAGGFLLAGSRVGPDCARPTRAF